MLFWTLVDCRTRVYVGCTQRELLIEGFEFVFTKTFSCRRAPAGIWQMFSMRSWCSCCCFRFSVEFPFSLWTGWFWISTSRVTSGVEWAGLVPGLKHSRWFYSSGKVQCHLRSRLPAFRMTRDVCWKKIAKYLENDGDLGTAGAISRIPERSFPSRTWNVRSEKYDWTNLETRNAKLAQFVNKSVV